MPTKNDAHSARDAVGVRHLEQFADAMLRDLGDRAPEYLRRCIPHWREHYGEDAAKRLGQYIAAKLRR